jgi:hypothetical protein
MLKTPKTHSLFIRYFFILTIVTCVIKVDNSLAYQSSYTNEPAQSYIELIVPTDYNASLTTYFYDTNLSQTSPSASVAPDFFQKHAQALDYYQNIVCISLKLFRRPCNNSIIFLCKRFLPNILSEKSSIKAA